ncbi:MAG: glc operon protein GlcG [Alphaproteobacteria bacterium]|jgi:glc operon protein GlcG|nr:glc operon protein GlcG [Alphaproteobacteria bacterium]
MRNKPQMTLEDAYKIADAVRAAAAKLNRAGTIAVVDSGGHLLYLERPDRQSPNSVEIATLKARTAAYRERPSSALQERVKERPGWLMFPNSLPIAGGVPLFYGDECVGGVGVSGIADDDEVVAQAGAEVLQPQAG